MRSVLITGASSGIGRDAALHFNELGYLVFAGVRKPADGQRLTADATRPDSCRPVIFDVTDREQVSTALAVVTAELGTAGLDVLISNAGLASMSGATSCEQCPIDVQQHVMDVNFFGAVRVVQTFLPLVRAVTGTVIFNTALMAHTVIPFNAGYAASKCALEGWADSLRRELGPLGVRVAIIEAGYIASELETKQRSAASAADDRYPAAAGLHHAMSRSSTKLAGHPSASPRRMSEAMADAAQRSRPKPRRIVGTGARAIWTLGCLPDRIQDIFFRIALTRFARHS